MSSFHIFTFHFHIHLYTISKLAHLSLPQSLTICLMNFAYPYWLIQNYRLYHFISCNDILLVTLTGYNASCLVDILLFLSIHKLNKAITFQLWQFHALNLFLFPLYKLIQFKRFYLSGEISLSVMPRHRTWIVLEICYWFIKRCLYMLHKPEPIRKPLNKHFDWLGLILNNFIMHSIILLSLT